jgi:hypothetical protein
MVVSVMGFLVVIVILILSRGRRQSKKDIKVLTDWMERDMEDRL